MKKIKFLPLGPEKRDTDHKAVTLDQRVVFAVGEATNAKTSDKTPLLVLGVPKGAWAYMKRGETHTFDLRPAGIDLKLVMYGGDSHDHVKKLMGRVADVSSAEHKLHEDFGIKT